MRLSPWWIVVSAAGLMLGGCAPAKNVIRIRMTSADEVLKRVHARSEKIKTLKGDGTITIENPEASSSGSFEVNLKKPDSVHVDVHGPLGIRVGTLMLARERFLFYDWRANRATTGKSDGSALSSVLRMNLRFDEIVQSFTGDFLVRSSTDTLMQFTAESDAYVLTFRSGDATKEYHVDADSFIVLSYRLLDRDGKPSMIALASRIEDQDTVTMPKLLRVIFPKERRSVSIAYSGVEVNRPVQCLFSPPKQAEVIER